MFQRLLRGSDLQLVGCDLIRPQVEATVCDDKFSASDVYMTFLPRYFVNADMSDTAEIPMLQTIIDNHFDSGGKTCSPGAVEQLGQRCTREASWPSQP